ncbi:MAG: transposase [Candidatus Woesearchaeota archaeon]
MKNPSVTVKEILSVCWDDYIKGHDVKGYQIHEVEKALRCYGEHNGGFVYFCEHCDKFIFKSKGCNSRICSCCGKRYADQWAVSLSQAMFPVPHRHFVMSVPSQLWPSLRDWNLMKVYMGAAIKAFNDFFSHVLRRPIKVGVIAVLHPFGKDMRFQPHLHLLITEGGFDGQGRFVKCEYVPADGFRKTWQYHALTELKRAGVNAGLIAELYDLYRKGFYVWLHQRGRISHPKLIARYIGRYVRHPAIANSRIYFFDGKIVKFFYINNEDIRIDVTMTADEFITALIQHIPPPQFRMIRYYGAYARRNKRRYGGRVHSAIRQLNLFAFGVERAERCPICHRKMEFVLYTKKPPPLDKEKLVYWIESLRREAGFRER